MSVRTPMTLAGIETGAGLRAALDRTPAEVVAAMKASGIKGRGGAGFPTGLKWELAAGAPSADGRRALPSAWHNGWRSGAPASGPSAPGR